MKSEPRTISLDSLEIDLLQYWLIVKRRWFPAIRAFSFVLLLAVLFSSFLQKPTYRAQGKLLLRVDRTAALIGVGTEGGGAEDVGTKLGEFSPLTLQNSPLKTESEILLSAPLLQKAIAQLKLRDQTGHLLQPESLQKRLEVKQVTGADVLQISFEDKNPEVAAALVNQLMQEYLTSNISMSRRQVTAARQVIAEQLPKAKSALQEADSALRLYKERNSITNLDEESKSFVAAESDLEAQITKAQTALAAANSRLVALQDKVGLSSDVAVELSSLSQSPEIREALKDFQEAQKQLALERILYTEKHPTVVNLKQKEATLRALLQTRVSEILGRPTTVPDGSLQLGEAKQALIQKFVDTEIERLGLASEVSLLSNSRNLYRQRSMALPRLEQGQRELERNLEVAQATYITLQKKLQELQVAEQQNTGNATIVEAASIPDKPSSKKKLITLVLGGLLASLAGLSTMIVLEVSDRTVKTLKEARQLFNYPWLGSIPKFSQPLLQQSRNAELSPPTLLVRDFPQSPVSAAFRLLQANLKFLNVEKEIKIIVVTSSVPKEGKSTISANLAGTIAQLGRRVLLVDTDLHHPQQHHLWHLTNTVGLSNVIVKQIDFNAAVNTVMDNLDVLTSGVIPPNPLALLDSSPMKTLIDFAVQKYDFVILDASPLIVEAEALTLGKMTDGLLLVVRPGVLDFTSANIAKELLEQSAQTVLGMVANCASSEAESNRFPYYKQDQVSLPSSVSTLK